MSSVGVKYQVSSITCQVPVSDIKCRRSGVKYNMSSAGVRYQVLSITCRCQYHILTHIAMYHVLKATVAIIRHVAIKQKYSHIIYQLA